MYLYIHSRPWMVDSTHEFSVKDFNIYTYYHYVYM